MTKIYEYVPPLARVQQMVRKGSKERPFDLPGMKEPIAKIMAFDALPNNQKNYFLHLAKPYQSKPDYGKELKNGWPGVKGPVYLGIPLVNRFGEVIVIYREKEGGALKSTVLGTV